MINDMKPERIQLFGPGGFFTVLLRAAMAFSKHDDAVDFSKTVRRIVDSVGAEASLWIDDRHTLEVEIELEGDVAPSAVEEEVAERIRIAYAVLSTTPGVD